LGRTAGATPNSLGFPPYVAAKIRAQTLAHVRSRRRRRSPTQDHYQHLLTALLGAQVRYCLPLPRLGSQYVSDFVIGEVDSLGVRWVLVELETPRSSVYLQDGRQFDEKIRNAMAQIASWRDWLMHNLADARRPRAERGLGLIDIRPNAPATVIIGRRARLNSLDDVARHQSAEFVDIEVQTYDRLLERLRGAIQHQGPPTANRHLIRRTEAEELF
jgi:hypothetical protein